MNTEIIVYNLISVDWSTEYDFNQESPIQMMRDDNTIDDIEGKSSEVKVDAEGIPMGVSTDANHDMRT